MNMINHNDQIKQYQLVKHKYSIYALDEWLLCSCIGQHSPAYCRALVDIIIITIVIIIIIIIIIVIVMKYGKREKFYKHKGDRKEKGKMLFFGPAW